MKPENSDTPVLRQFRVAPVPGDVLTEITHTPVKGATIEDLLKNGYAIEDNVATLMVQERYKLAYMKDSQGWGFVYCFDLAADEAYTLEELFP